MERMKPTFFFNGRMPVIVTLLCVLPVDPAEAQDVVPGIVDPGRIQQRIDLPEPDERQPETPEIKPTALVPPDEASKIRFVLRDITFSGVTVYTKEDLEPHYEDLLNREISLRDIYEVLDEIIARYRSDDYALVSGLIPGQDFSDGSVQVRIIEGHVNKIIMPASMEEDDDLALLNSHADAVRADKPLHKSVLLRHMLLANDIPGLKVDGRFQPSSETGAVDLPLKGERERFETFGSIDNHGPEELGPTQFQVGATYNSLFRLGDSTSVTFGGTPDIDTLKYGFFRHTQVVNASGLRLEGEAGIIKTRPDITGLEGLEGEATVYSLRGRYPFLRGPIRNLFFFGSFDALNSENAFLPTGFLSSDHLRSLRAGAHFTQRDRWKGNNAANVALSQGLDIWDARAGSRSSGRVDYTKINFFLQRLQQFGDHFSAVLSTRGQYAFSSLLSPEEFGYGGRDYGRAFRPSEITGDHGIAGSLELRYRNAGFGFLKSYEPYAFVDAGKVWRRDEQFLIRQSSGAAGGGGLRFEISDYFTLELEAAAVIHRSRPEIGDDDWKFLFRITGES